MLLLSIRPLFLQSQPVKKPGGARLGSARLVSFAQTDIDSALVRANGASI